MFHQGCSRDPQLTPPFTVGGVPCRDKVDILHEPARASEPICRERSLCANRPIAPSCRSCRLSPSRPPSFPISVQPAPRRSVWKSHCLRSAGSGSLPSRCSADFCSGRDADRLPAGPPLGCHARPDRNPPAPIARSRATSPMTCAYRSGASGRKWTACSRHAPGEMAAGMLERTIGDMDAPWRELVRRTCVRRNDGHPTSSLSFAARQHRPPGRHCI